MPDTYQHRHRRATIGAAATLIISFTLEFLGGGGGGAWYLVLCSCIILSVPLQGISLVAQRVKAKEWRL